MKKIMDIFIMEFFLKLQKKMRNGYLCYLLMDNIVRNETN